MSTDSKATLIWNLFAARITIPVIWLWGEKSEENTMSLSHNNIIIASLQIKEMLLFLDFRHTQRSSLANIFRSYLSSAKATIIIDKICLI